VSDGRVKVREDVVHGLENAPEAFIGLLQGRNFGKLVISLSDDHTGQPYSRGAIHTMG
jgi:NADPH-dependent curcumin reductase CurA